MEALSSKPASLTALHRPLSLSLSPYTENILVKSTLRVRKQDSHLISPKTNIETFDTLMTTREVATLGLQTLSFFAPISGNPTFHPSLIDGAFSIWSNSGIKTFSD